MNKFTTSKLIEYSHLDESWINHKNGDIYKISISDVSRELPSSKGRKSTDKKEDRIIQYFLVEGLLDGIVEESTKLEYPDYEKEIKFLEKSIISHNLWNEYTRDHEYIKLKYDHGIRDDHPMIIEKESMGLKSIYKFFVIEKLRSRNSIDSFSMREPSEWLKEWKDMHSLLFRFVLNKNHLRKWRKVDVRFGSPGDEDNYKIPLLHMVSYEIEKLASNISTYISRTKIEDNEKYQILAKIHYEFIRIHPFKDENGRIARVLTDQISLFFRFPPALSGYPRHDLNRRLRYHKAINLCISDPQCLLLSEWIKSYIEAQTFQIS